MSFPDDLRHGRGRAILHLLSCDQATREGYREVILTACTTDQRYDHELEPSRGPYLWNVLRKTREPQWYAPHLAALLAKSNTAQSQLAYLYRALTIHNLADLREPLYAACEQDLLAGNTDTAELLIPWEGPTAWRFVLEHAPESIEHWELWSLFEVLGEQYGKKTARQACDDKPALRHTTGALLRQERLERQKRRRNWRNKRQQPIPTYDAIMDSLHQRRPLPHDWQKDSALLQRLAATPPTEPEALRRWLFLFRNHPYPLDPAPLLALTEHEDDYIAWRAINALGQLTHPAVRAFALEMLHSERFFWPAAPRLLARNRAPGDIERIERLWERCQEDSAIWSFGVSVLIYLEVNPDAPLVPLLLRLFEETPSSFTRYSLATELHQRNALTPELIAECRWDCNEDTRALVTHPSRSDLVSDSLACEGG